MKKIVGIIAALMLVAGVAFAVGGEDPIPAAGNYDVGGEGLANDTASVDQSITVTIPERVALHIDTVEWNLDLGNIADEACYAISKETAALFGPGDAELAFGVFAGLGAEALNELGITTWDAAKDALNAKVVNEGGDLGIYLASSYPAVSIVSGNDRIEGDHDKGYVACFFGKVVQKFANTPWEFSASIYASNADHKEGFGHFGLADIRAGGAESFVTSFADGTSHVLDGDSTTTGGWLDDYILEGFYFDGSEEAGTYDLTVTYTLTGTN